MDKVKPAIFIGSSVEGLNTAYAIQEELEHDAEATIWSQGIFQPMGNVLDDLLTVLSKMDFGIFVFTPDDVLTIRQNQKLAVRDNVLFEFGLFIGRLGKERCFFIFPRSAKDLHLPTDLLGITPLIYEDKRLDDNLIAAVGSSCNKVRQSLRNFGTTEKKSLGVAHDYSQQRKYSTAGNLTNRPSVPVTTPESFLPLIHVDVLELNFGFGLLQLVDESAGGDLLDRISIIRQKTALEIGIVIPTVRIRDDLHLKANDYTIKLKGATVATGTVHPNSIMLIDPGSVIDPITDGIPAKEPAFGVPAQWVSRNHRDRAEMAGYTMVDPSSVITTHLAEVIKGYASEIITRQGTSALIDHVKQANSAVVEELIPNLMTVGEVQKVLQHLLRERISVRDLVTILETLADNAGRTKSVDTLGEWVRSALARSICRQYVDDASGALQTLTLDPNLEQQLLESIAPGLPNLALEPSFSRQLIQNLNQQIERMIALGYQQPVLLCMSSLRLPLRRLTERSLPNLVILSYNEIVPNTEVRAVGMVPDGFSH